MSKTEVCRVCMEREENVVFLFNKCSLTNQSPGDDEKKTFADILRACVGVNIVDIEDKLPKFICQNCCNEMQKFYFFKQKVENSYRVFYRINNDITPLLKKEISTQTEECERVSSSSEKPEHSCQLCDKTFAVLKDLRRHMLKEHMHTNDHSDLKIPCPICDRIFSRKDHMRRHILKIHKEDPSKYLKKRIKEELDLHCPICERNFTRKDHLKRHLSLVHNLKVSNTTEQRTAETENTTELEKEVYLNESSWNDTKIFPAKNPFASDSEFENELPVQTALGMIKQEPNEEFILEEEHKEEKLAEVLSVGTLEANVDHVGMHEDVEYNGSDSYSDELQDKSPIGEEFYTDEIGNDHLVKSSMLTIFAEEAKPISNKRHSRGDGTIEERTCQLCQRLFSRLCHLRRHMQSAHTQEKPHCCPHCEKKFTRSDHLKNHIQGVHAERTHKCDMCEKSFSRTEALQKHKEARHGDSTGAYKIHECEFCQRKFTGKRYLARHRLLHTDRIFACRFCEETFKDRKVFREHERGHKSNERNFLCSICGDSFVRNDYLRVHMRRHLGEKPYKCQYCGKGFPRATDLKVHERYHTNTKPSVCTICGKAFHRAYNLTIHMRIHTGEKPYKCEHCPKSFAQSNDLKAHVRRHTGERYKCDKCDATFLQLYGLRQHALSAHGVLIESSTGRLQKVGALISTKVTDISIDNGDAIQSDRDDKSQELLNLNSTQIDSQAMNGANFLQPPATSPLSIPYANVAASEIFKAQFMQLK